MRAFRFAHLADAHVGAWARDSAMRAAHRASVLRALQAVADEHCDFLVIAGDLFHNPTPEPAEAAPVARALRHLNDLGIRIYAIFGSHDYVVHQTSWLDVLSEGGLFVRVAPETLREEGKEWELPWIRDEPTGALIAGVSGRTQGLDAHAFETMRSENFVQEKGFHIFLYHAAITECLPKELREMVEGVPLDQLPKSCEYYAGGHIHETYEGTGPDGHGVLVNPGATFGTAVTDLDKISRGLTRAGIVIVDVDSGVAHPRWVVTTPKESVRFVDIDVQTTPVQAATHQAEIALGDVGAPGAAEILVPRLHGERDGTFDVAAFSTALRTLGADVVHLDLNDLTARATPPATPIPIDPDDLEGSILTSFLSGAPPLPGMTPTEALQVAREVLRDLRRAQTPGETSEDYRRRMTQAAIQSMDRGRPTDPERP